MIGVDDRVRQLPAGFIDHIGDVLPALGEDGRSIEITSEITSIPAAGKRTAARIDSSKKIIKINQTQNPIRSFSRFFPVCGNSISSAIIVATSSLPIESKSIANSLVACAVFAFSMTFLTYLPLPKSFSFLAASNKRNSFSQASSVSVRPLCPAIVFAISQRASVS